MAMAAMDVQGQTWVALIIVAVVIAVVAVMAVMTVRRIAARIVLIVIAVALQLLVRVAVLISVISMARRGVYMARHRRQWVCSGPWNQLPKHGWGIRWKTARWQPRQGREDSIEP
uniref:Uncharacterized protein n=1 Tax=Romanomermis culicivorax TaxID=13658 RepID=A0A915KSX0_ROMCU